MAAEQPRHLRGRFQEPLRIGLELQTGLVDGGLFTDAGQHVLQGTAFIMVVEDGVAGDHGSPRPLGDPGQARQPRPIVAAMSGRRGQIERSRPGLAPGLEPGLESVVEAHRRGDQRDHSLAQRDRLVEIQPALPLGDAGLVRVRGPALDAALTDGQQPAKPSVGGAIARIDDQRRSVVEHQPAADQQAQPHRLGRGVGADHAGQAVAVGDPDGDEAKRLGLLDQFGRMRAAFEEAEIGAGVELGVRAHAKTPAIHQEGARSASSRP